MKKYLAYDDINGDYHECHTIEEARSWLEEIFLDENGYHPGLVFCKIYELKEVASFDVVAKKKDYKYEYEDDIPEDDKESEAWPYDSEYDEIWKHKFVPVEHLQNGNN